MSGRQRFWVGLSCAAAGGHGQGVSRCGERLWGDCWQGRAKDKDGGGREGGWMMGREEGTVWDVP